MGTISCLSFENTRTRHCRVVVVVLVAMAVRTRFSRFFDGVLLSQKTHGLLLASVYFYLSWVSFWRMGASARVPMCVCWYPCPLLPPFLTMEACLLGSDTSGLSGLEPSGGGRT